MVVVPVATPVATPDAVIVTKFAAVDAHVTKEVRSTVAPVSNVPSALNCRFVSIAMEEARGDILSEIIFPG